MHLPAATPIPLAPAQATPRADIEKAARELEAQFAHMLIKSMRSASGGDPLGGDTRYREMYDQQLARELTKGRGLGLAPMIVRQLERSAGTAPAPATAAPAAMPLRRGGGRAAPPRAPPARPARPARRAPAPPRPGAPGGGGGRAGGAPAAGRAGVPGAAAAAARGGARRAGAGSHPTPGVTLA